MKKIIFVFIVLYMCITNLFAQDNYAEFRKKMSEIEKHENELRDIIWGKNQLLEAQKDSASKIHKVLTKDKVVFAKKAIHANPSDERFLKVLDIYVRNFLTLDEFEQELNKFSAEVRNTDDCKKKYRFIKYARLNVPGNKCVDFEVMGHDGKKVKLSDVLVKNKLVLIDFWASWCGACRATMPHLKKIYPEYKKQGVEFFCVSLDDNEEAWKKAHTDEKIPWIDGSNLLGWKDPLVEYYAIRGIPHKVLIDNKGVIIGSGFHQLGSLEKTIDKYLKKK